MECLNSQTFQRRCYIWAGVKIALTKKKKKKKLKKFHLLRNYFFCDIYVTYGLEGCIINV